jgi:hypothetical protein
MQKERRKNRDPANPDCLVQARIRLLYMQKMSGSPENLY